MSESKFVIVALALATTGFSAAASAHGTVVVYAPAPVYYAPPPAVYWAASPVVVYRPYPVYVVRSAPVYYPPYVVRYPRYRHHHYGHY